MKSATLSFLRLAAVLVLAVLASPRAVRAAESANNHPVIHVILWFDTEDYLLPADDDADKRLADMLSERGVHATFKVVGEKARELQRRGRHDVIDALRRHCIAYHSNLHSVHPAPAEYLANCGLLDGVQEFVRREARGAADVRHIFNVPTLACYGQPGSSWAAQAVAGLAQCGIGTDGIPCYVDSGKQIGIGGVPYWYEGVLTVYDMAPNETRMDLWADGGLAKGTQAFAEIANRLTGEGGGLISIYYHPCEWVHREFWDSVNFKRGANPPREQWKAPRQRPAEETDAAFERFGKYIDAIRATPGVQFITACQLPSLYPDPVREHGATKSELTELARRITSPSSTGLDFQIIDNKSFSPADQFALLADGFAQQVHSLGQHPSNPTNEHDAADPAICAGLLGPDGEPPATSNVKSPLDWYAFRDAALDADDIVRTEHRIPARVFIGPDAVAPADFLSAMATAYLMIDKNGTAPQSVPLGKDVQLLTARRVVQDAPGVYGGWVIHREGYRAPKVLEVARLQAWTLKPAIPARMSRHD